MISGVCADIIESDDQNPSLACRESKVADFTEKVAIGDCAFTNQARCPEGSILRPSCYVSAGSAAATACSSDLWAQSEIEGISVHDQPFASMS
jgi:hypothetical protein